jgi:hypothetical protein
LKQEVLPLRRVPAVILVERRVDALLRPLRNLDVVLGRHAVEHLLVCVAGDKRDGEAFGAESAGTTDAMQVGEGIRGQIVVDGKVDALNVDAAAEDVGGDTDARAETLELLVALDAG